MKVPPQHTEHERAEELPLITDSATVAGVGHMGHNRTEEVVERVTDLLAGRGYDEWVEEVERPGANDVDWDRLSTLLENEEGSHERLYAVLSTLKERYDRAYPALLTARIDVEDEFGFSPGQYVTLRYRRTPRPYSVASSPNEDALEFCVRRVPRGRLTTKLFDDLSEGDEVTVRGPNGEFVLEEPSGRDMAFLATGTGVAPLRSMIRYTLEEGRDEVGGDRRDLWLFLGATWKDDLPYREEFRELDDEHENFHFVPTCSREEYLTDWEGETDYVQQTLVKYLAASSASDLPEGIARFADDPAYDIDARIHPDELEVYACGVNAMVSRLAGTARLLGVPDEHIQYEGYG
ncbi:ferredoxin--NADP reductase [Haladaptatus salinisoli]|uniref:ferredoxin--NADP reductase n=1 Tax=Haladaptatus salinisoli TaxID=2884876 RepID=UPI001D0B0D22|nr:FAD-binding oxidoreductase [Haladaptatus salinisoli]